MHGGLCLEFSYFVLGKFGLLSEKIFLKKLYLGLVIVFIPSIPKPEEVFRKLWILNLLAFG